jgi:hypothetical protein
VIQDQFVVVVEVPSQRADLVAKPTRVTQCNVRQRLREFLLDFLFVELQADAEVG